MVEIRQGDVWWADLGEPSGSEPGFRRPVVVVQGNALNRSRLATVVCVRLTSNVTWADAPGNTRLSAKVTGLSKESVAKASQITALDRAAPAADAQHRYAAPSRTGHDDHSSPCITCTPARRRRLYRTSGRPTREAIDSDGVEAVFLLVQHADRDPAFQAAILPLLDSANRKGEIDGQSLALLTDRVAKAQGRPQVFGTQTTAYGRDLVIDPIADSEAVDTRRAELGVPPLAVYKQMLDSVLAHAGAP